MSRVTYAVFEDLPYPHGPARRISCPSCHVRIGDQYDVSSMWGVGLSNGVKYIRIPTADRDGVPAFGWRRGTYISGRDPVHHRVAPERQRRTIPATLDTGQTVDAGEVFGTFAQRTWLPDLCDCWCPACHRRLRIDIRRPSDMMGPTTR
jgi:hypothetical protein